jgi:hypothetical protein
MQMKKKTKYRIKKRTGQKGRPILYSDLAIQRQ